jgi:hypothetical protein
MELGLEEKDPTSWPTPTALEWGPELLAERRGGSRVGLGRTRVHHELAVHDLCDDVLGRGEDILVRGSAARRERHRGMSVPPGRFAPRT